MLEFILSLTYIYCGLYSPHILSVSTLYSSRGLLVFSLFLSYCLFKNVFLFSHSHWVYIATNTSLYPYVLPVDYSFYPFSSLCLSYNLSQA